MHWIKPDGKGSYRIVEVDCDGNLNEAIRIFSKAKEAGKKFATLRCRNSGFPPPDKYLPHHVWVKKEVKSGRRTKVVRMKEMVYPMKKLNRKGIFWCPYCREMRKFKLVGGHYPQLECFICGTTHRDFHVRAWNPTAARMYMQAELKTSTRRRRAA